jgi:tRNA A37 methylthiotransferase MiaB
MVPELTLSTDVIAGFPGEEEADFDQTCSLLEELRPNIVNITRYSERPGTPSVKMSGKLHGRTSKARSRKLTELCAKISLDLNEQLVGNEFDVLASEKNIGGYEKTTLTRTDSYRPVVVNEELELGKRYKVKITSATEAYLKGNIV